MSAECYPISTLPHSTRLYADFLDLGAAPAASPLRTWYGSQSERPPTPNSALADALSQQAELFGAGPEQQASIEQLRTGACAIVTGQQVGLFGGPLLTLLKAATAVARARQASTQSGVPHVPIFWLATEDHDLAEVDQITLPTPEGLETLTLGLRSHGTEVGAIPLGAGVEPLLARIRELLAYAPICDLLERCYTPATTLGTAFAQLLSALFAPHGLIVMDASTRAFHALGAPMLRAAIERAEELESALLARTAELERAGYSAQVLVRPGASLLFLLHARTGERQPLRRLPDGSWKAGQQAFTSSALLEILDATPERLSPNALLRPLFQDTILPTAAYIGGPAEIAYFAQCGALYERIFDLGSGRNRGSITPILPRFSATLTTPADRALLARHELTLADLWSAATPDVLAQRLGARAMPIEGKRKIAAAGNAMDAELSALTEYLASTDPDLGRSALVSASKMRYQMNRLRRMAARFELEKNTSLGKQANALMRTLYPHAHLQERILGGIALLAQAASPEDLISTLIAAAADRCPGHVVLPID